MLGILGDVHGHWRELKELIQAHPEISSWLQVGDLGGLGMSYPDFEVPFYFISGNHENWDEIEDIDKGKGPRNLHHIKNGEAIVLDDIKILGFGGNFSPRYSKGKEKLLGDRRRHNTSEELSQALKVSDVDIFLCHEPPKPYITRNKECGIENINKILVAVKPKLCFFGHHHYVTLNTPIDFVPCTGLDYGWRSYVRVNTTDRKYKFIKIVGV